MLNVGGISMMSSQLMKIVRIIGHTILGWVSAMIISSGTSQATSHISL
jgi:hypothetical protein